MLIVCHLQALNNLFTFRILKFNAKQDSVINAIKTTYGFENITFIAKKQSGSGGEHSSVIVKFINGKKIPSDSTKMYDLEKQLGTQVKKSKNS